MIPQRYVLLANTLQGLQALPSAGHGNALREPEVCAGGGHQSVSQGLTQQSRPALSSNFFPCNETLRH